MNILPLTLFSLAFSGAVISSELPQRPLPVVSTITYVAPVNVVKKSKIQKSKIRQPKLRILKPIPALAPTHGVDYGYPDDDDDAITIQTITQLRPVNRKFLDTATDKVAERLSMIKWIVLMKMANITFS